MSRALLTAPMLVAVAAGGAGGAVLRWALDVAVPDGNGFPWTTFGINLSGAFLLAVLPALAAVRERPLLTLALGPGVLGGFTTLSAYAEQARALFAAGSSGLAGLYLAGTLASCLVAVHFGSLLTTPATRRAFAEREGNA